ncbi:hypothetical protein CYMTET_34458, partial [Cymbomonas tetramitiformis]
MEHVAVLGVDFMAENVRAVMDGAGWADVGVYRMSSDAIGCSLAEAAESDVYYDYLKSSAGATKNNLHVIYINTSLETKARAHGIMPTITCTSSNVVTTILQAAAEIPDLTVYYGPDARTWEAIWQISSHALCASGTCVVHHLFGGEVCSMVRAGYSDAYQTAHFEVPGEMFALAMEAKGWGATHGGRRSGETHAPERRSVEPTHGEAGVGAAHGGGTGWEHVEEHRGREPPRGEAPGLEEAHAWSAGLGAARGEAQSGGTRGGAGWEPRMEGLRVGATRGGAGGLGSRAWRAQGCSEGVEGVAQERGMGTVGSTSDILGFIGARVEEALEKDFAEQPRFVLGTETGMVTSIVNSVQDQLRQGISA